MCKFQCNFPPICFTKISEKVQKSSSSTSFALIKGTFLFNTSSLFIFSNFVDFISYEEQKKNSHTRIAVSVGAMVCCMSMTREIHAILILYESFKRKVHWNNYLISQWFKFISASLILLFVVGSVLWTFVEFHWRKSGGRQSSL